jgi:hypothetical protein
VTDTDWHAAPGDLARFATAPASLDDMTASSLEAHLVACARCRADVAAAMPRARLAGSWDAIADRIDRPRPTLFERLVPRGVSGTLARLVAATPALQAAGLAAIATLAFGAAALSRAADAEGPFLVLAPLAPLVAVAGSFAPAADPAGEAGVATPLHGVGLVVWRSVVALTATMALLGLATVLLPELDPSAVAWILPSLALSAGVVALGTWLRAEVALGLLAGAWLFLVVVARWVLDLHTPLASTVTFAPTGQLVAGALALAALAVAIARRDHFATMEVSR